MYLGAREFELRFRLNNAAFADGNESYEIARILRHIAESVERIGAFEGVVKDANGNTVGSWSRDDLPDEPEIEADDD